MPSATGIDVLGAVARLAAAPASRDKHGLRARFRQEALELARAEGLVEAAWSYHVIPLDGDVADGPLLSAGGTVLHAPRLIPDSGTLTGLAFAVCTIGPRLGERVSSLFAERRVSLALALDDLGNALLLELVRRMEDRILVDVRRQGLSMSGELRAGDPGLALEAQTDVLRLAGADSIGVAVSSGMSLQPLKSASMVQGVGIGLPVASWSRCDDCAHSKKCRVAKEGREARGLEQNADSRTQAPA